jgi:signal transduction histidine kinase
MGPSETAMPAVGALEEQYLEIAMDIGRMGAWEWDIATGQVTWSASLERIHGLEPGTFTGTFEAYQSDMHPEDRGRVLAAIQEAVETGVDHHIEYRIVIPSGDVRWLDARGRVFNDAVGRPVRMLGICADVTDARREARRRDFLVAASQTLAASLDYETTLRRVAELAVPHVADWCAVDLLEGEQLQRLAVAHTDPEKVAIAQTFHREYPPKPDDAYGSWAVIRSGCPEMLQNITEEQMEAGAVDARQVELLRALGLCSYVIVPIRVEDRVIGAITFVNADSKRPFDPLDLQLAEALASTAGVAIEKAVLFRQARRAIESRDELMAMVSHDLRNPLHVLVLRVSTLEARLARLSAVEPKLMDDIAALGVAGNRMARMVRDLVDSVAIEGGGLQLIPRVEDVAALVAKALPELEVLARQAGQRLELETSGLEDLCISCDAERVMQVLENLVTNAAKFGSRAGRILMQVRGIAAGVELSVTDEGPGVSQELRARIFERYVKSEDARGGLGLGLYIAKAIVRGHGGRLWVEDAPEGGAVFRIFLPTKPR